MMLTKTLLLRGLVMNASSKLGGPSDDDLRNIDSLTEYLRKYPFSPLGADPRELAIMLTRSVEDILALDTVIASDNAVMNAVMNAIASCVPAGHKMLGINQDERVVLLRNDDSYLLVHEYSFDDPNDLETFVIKGQTADGMEDIRRLFHGNPQIRPMDASIYEKPM